MQLTSTNVAFVFLVIMCWTNDCDPNEENESYFHDDSQGMWWNNFSLRFAQDINKTMLCTR